MSGQFSSAQRQLYEILLTVQKDLIQYGRENNHSKTFEYSCVRLMIKQIINYLSPASVGHHLGKCKTPSFISKH